MNARSFLVVNADDYGLHHDINRGIRYCIEKGLVNSVSIAVNGPAIDKEEVAALLKLKKQFPDLSTGIHLMLTEGIPLTASPTSWSGNIFPLHAFDLLWELIKGRIRLDDVHKEWEEQISKLDSYGIHPDHLDSHQHVHLIPGLWHSARSIALKYHIPRIRTSYHSFLLALYTFDLRVILFQILAFLRHVQIPHALKTFGVLSSCRFNVQSVLADVETATRKRETIEIMVHPAFSTENLQKTFGYWKASFEKEIFELEILQKIVMTHRVPDKNLRIAFKSFPFLVRCYVRIRNSLCPFGFLEKLVPIKGNIVSCGAGYGIFPVILHLGSGYRTITAIENDPRRCKVLHRLGTQHGFSVVEEDAGNYLQNTTGKFECISFIDVLYQIPYGSQNTLLSLAFDRLDKGGTILIKETCRSFRLRYMVAYMEECLVNSFMGRKLSFRYFYRTLNQWRLLVEKTGFAKVRFFRSPGEKCNNFSWILLAEKDRSASLV
jgi:predicted glycoside hydrolase/deacetylase ChbG (UPF0249 family)